MRIKGWEKVKNTNTIYKWRRVSDNSFLEVTDSKKYGYIGGYIAVLWTKKSAKPYGIAGGKTKAKILKKCKSYMKKHPRG